MYYMYFYMPALELNELLSMRKMLPRYKVKHAHKILLYHHRISIATSCMSSIA